MEQKSFDFNRHQSDLTCSQLTQEQQQQLVDLMSSLIINVYQPSEEKEYDPAKKQ
jgi:hypothetical protein